MVKDAKKHSELCLDYPQVSRQGIALRMQVVVRMTCNATRRSLQDHCSAPPEACLLFNRTSEAAYDNRHGEYGITYALMLHGKGGNLGALKRLC